MKKLKITLFIVTIFTIHLDSTAQFLDNLGKRVENKVEETITRKAENKAGEKTEEAVDVVLESDKAKKKTDQSTEEVDVKSQYIFTFTATIIFENKEENSSISIKQSYGDGYILAKTKDNLMLQDFEAKQIIVINEKDKSATVMSMKWMEKMLESVTKESKSDKNAKIERTGNTKTIQGYLCFEYILTSDDSRTQIWFAPSVPFSYDNYLKSMSKIFGGKSNTISKGEGYVMEMTSFDKKGKETSHLFIQSVSEKIFTISLGEYKINKMM